MPRLLKACFDEECVITVHHAPVESQTPCLQHPDGPFGTAHFRDDIKQRHVLTLLLLFGMITY